MITKHVLPDERLNISVKGWGPKAIKASFDEFEGIEQALELDEREAITFDLTTHILTLHLTNRSGEVVEWRERIYGSGRQGIIEGLIKNQNNARSITEDIIRLRSHRDEKMPQAWQYKTQPLVKRLIAATGHEPGQFLKACALHPGKIHNLAVKPQGITRRVKLDVFLPFEGEMKPGELLISHIKLGSGAFLNWKGGMHPGYNIDLAQDLPQTIKDSLVGTYAANLVDDPRAKAMLEDMIVTGFGDNSMSRRIVLSLEEDEAMEDEPTWVKQDVDRLNNRLAEWAEKQSKEPV